MPDTPKPVVTPPPIKYRFRLLLVAIAVVIIGIGVVLLGKLIVGGIISLLGAVFGLGAQVAGNDKLRF